jgi:hypothetical protein
VTDLVAGARTVQCEQHRHRVDGVGQVTVGAVQRLGGEVRFHRMAVPRKGKSGDRLVRALEGRAQSCGERALACAVDTLDHDEHAGSVARTATPATQSSEIAAGFLCKTLGAKRTHPPYRHTGKRPQPRYQELIQ